MTDDRPPHDALDPGDDPANPYPHLPRDPSGAVDRVRFPRGLHRQLQPPPGDRAGRPGRVYLLDLTQRDPDGAEIPPNPEE